MTKAMVTDLLKLQYRTIQTKGIEQTKSKRRAMQKQINKTNERSGKTENKAKIKEQCSKNKTKKRCGKQSKAKEHSSKGCTIVYYYLA